MSDHPWTQRAGPRLPTHKGMPDAQIGVRPVPQVDAELHRRCFALPDVREAPTMISVPGARAVGRSQTSDVMEASDVRRRRSLHRQHQPT